MSKQVRRGTLDELVMHQRLARNERARAARIPVPFTFADCHQLWINWAVRPLQ
jgi:hypothetical protein